MTDSLPTDEVTQPRVERWENPVQPKDAMEALRLIRAVVRDKRSHVMKEDHYDWIDLKMRMIGVLADRGIRTGVGKSGV